MDEKIRSILILAGMLTCLHGVVMQRYALARYRAPDSDGPWMSWNPKHWRERRDWFVNDYGYRLYRWAGWHTLLGGLAMWAAWMW